MRTTDLNGSDDDDSSYDNVQRPRQVLKNWDLFKDVAPSEESGSSVEHHGFDVAVRVTKVLAYLLTFTMVLGGAVVAKGTLLFMTSQLRANTTVPYCNKEIGPNKRFVVEVTDEERISWLWMIFFAFLVPELGTFFRSIRICFFKSFDKPKRSEFLVVFAMETLHTVGLVLLVFVVLPELDVVRGAMLTNCVCFVPALFGMLSRGNEETANGKQDSAWRVKLVMDAVALLCQASGLVVWPLLLGGRLWLVPLSVLLISCGWWENYVTLPRNTQSSSLKALRSFMLRLTDPRYRYYTYIYISVWKMLCFFGAMLLAVQMHRPTSQPALPFIFSDFLPSFQSRQVTVHEVQPIMSSPNTSDVLTPASDLQMDAWPLAPVWTLLVHVVSAYLCYIFAKFACKIRIQEAGMAFPANLTVPVSVCLLVTVCGLRNYDSCYFHGLLPDYLTFSAPDIYSLQDFVGRKHAWVWLLWLVSQMWVTVHLWRSQADSLASTDRLFVIPLYNSFLVDQSISMNRRRNDKDVSVRREDIGEASNQYDILGEEEIMDSENAVKSNVEFLTQTLQSPHVKPIDYITRVYACATMWHETYDEMICMIKSLLRLDVDQAIRKYLQQDLELVDPNYYEFETHILFDDAFVTNKDDGERVVNQWVKDFMRCMEDTVDAFHGVRLQPPTTIPTPYGGRLVWVLPGRNKILVHLKDKDKIRHRKRWSQVMYMYYLLGHRIMELPIHIDRKAVIAQNTYILAMDGDIDFQPQAVHLLIDLMKKNDTLGSSCGRIHPIGAGAMAWYQKFEYAIGHWLQKATEHMIGCVLCSPGAFSLFRARALMDQGVMKRYTFTATEPRHYVQFDQGEDRWLCTLLLQQGYRVEYSAASDAYTHCPESFDEFYNQRRRWVPSTMANIFDLLASYKQTIRINDNISAPYIFYHIVMMAGSILGPGTIFLMLVGAFVTAFKISNFVSLQYNLVPVIIFLFCCGVFSAKVQLFVAMVISSIYGLVMMAVVVGIAIQIQQDGPTAPSSIFFFMFLGELVFAALVHPREIDCLPAIIIYYVTVPSMYMLLIVYSLFNMNNITWGTREVAATPVGKTKKQLEEEKKAQEELLKNKKKKPLLGFLRGEDKNNEEGSIEFSLAGLFRCMCCTHPTAADDKIQLGRIAQSLDVLSMKLDALDRRMNPAPIPPRPRSSININGTIRQLDDPEDQEASDSESFDGINAMKRDDLINPYWISALGVKGTVHFLSDNELDFWKGLIDKYLHPIDENKEEQKKTAKALKELRNKCVFAFLMLNALFVLVIFLLQINQDTIHLKWPLGVTNTITFNSTANEVVIVRNYLSLEPIGIVFVAFFAVVLVVQFIGMLMHRLSTLSHLLASTKITCGGSKDETDMNEGIITEDLIKHLKSIKLYDINNPTDGNRKETTAKRIKRSTIHNLVAKGPQDHTAETIGAGLSHIIDNVDKFAGIRKFTARKSTLQVLANRKSTVTMMRRQSEISRRASSLSQQGVRPSQASLRPTQRQVVFANQGYQPSDESEMV